MLAQYLPILALGVLAFLFAALSFVATKLLAPRNPNDKKLAPYECGIVPTKNNPERFPVRFFLVAMIFIVFDIEIIFFYPWALAHRELGVSGLVAVLIFSVAVFESFIYLIGNGALEWGPIRRSQYDSGQSGQISTERTTQSTVVYIQETGVRRVGLEGRPENEEVAN
jgi:NADH-quinone oxidoreductase subunit A